MNLEKLQEYLGLEQSPLPPLAGPEAAEGAAANQAGDPGAPSPESGRPASAGRTTNAAGNARPAVADPASQVMYSPSVLERLQEIDLAQKLGYLICKCTWPPQIMVLSTSDFIYRCPRCARIRDL